MKTQISRHSRDPSKRYSGVYQQQGRMLTDADWNELAELVKERLDEGLRDVIGSGAPRGRGIVEVTAAANGGETVTLRWGRVYVDGIPAEVRPRPGHPSASGTAFVYDGQADFPAPPPVAGDRWLYLDVWERAITSLEDHGLRDPGLHGADTCARTQTMAQVKWCPLPVDPENPSTNPPRGTAALSLTLRRGSTDPDPCNPCADEVALQERVGNYLFRVEVHDVVRDASGQPTRLVLKWSSENGAEEYPVGSEPPGFKSSRWAFEFFSGADAAFASEKHLGVHLATGVWTPVRGALASGYPATPPPGSSQVRRWDGFCTLERGAGGAWALAAGGSDRGVPLSASSAGTAPGHVSIGPSLEIQLDAVVLTLALQGAAFVAGDYWHAMVREAVHGAGDVLLAAAPPIGIVHHYMTLAKVTGTTVTRYTGPQCQRSPFPPLTDLRADDVCYDGTRCDLPQGHSVQDALDHLCQQRNLPFHNRHLHGWGIVCGLQVRCGPDSQPTVPGQPAARRTVTVHKGYALDARGHDVLLESAIDRDVIALVDAHDAAAGKLILSDGNGTACLVLDTDGEGGPDLGVEPYKPEDLSSLLDGTVWSDVYEDCIKEPLEKAKKAIVDDRFDSDDPGARDLISPVKKRFATLLNLIVHMLSTDGQYVFLSPKEHEDLASRYVLLRELLRSKTFCGMFQGDEFPVYPFPNTGLATIFGEGFHTRVRLHPGGRYLYTCGGEDNRIHVYDLESRTMVAALDMPAGEGAMVKDVAFSRDGKRLYAAASLKGIDTVFGVAAVDGPDHSWRRVTVACDVELVTLANAPGDSDLLYAIGLRKGLFVLNPEELLEQDKPRPVPKFEFTATGQMTLDGTWVYAAATTSDDKKLSTYDRIVSMQPSHANGERLPPFGIRELKLQNDPVTGDDDLVHATATGANGVKLNRVYIVVRVPGGESRLLAYRVNEGTFSDLELEFPIQGSLVRLAFHPRHGKVLATVGESMRMQIIDIATDQVTVPRHPVQLVPIAVVVDKAKTTYVLNGLSNTITVIPDKELFVADDAFLAKLREYRYRVLGAYLQLFGGLLQFLKDCFCDHLLVDCPTDEDQTLYLACVEIRERKVYRICNFSKRKYVKSFPTVGYWLSVVPVLPFLKLVVEKVCCSILPNHFADFAKKFEPKDEIRKSLVKPTSVHGAVMTVKRTDFKGQLDALMKKAGVFRELGLDTALARVEDSSKTKPGVGKATLAGTPTVDAQDSLQKRGLIVDGVEPYDRAESGARLAEFSRSPDRLPPGTKVKLYERDGKVLFYAPVEEKELRVTGVSPEVTAELETFERRKVALRTELGAMKADLDRLEADRVAATAQVAEVEVRRTAMAEEVSSLRAAMAELSAMSKQLSVEVTRGRPVRDVSGVTADLDVSLRDLGIRTVAELASADVAVLGAANTGIDKRVAAKLVASAKKRLESE